MPSAHNIAIRLLGAAPSEIEQYYASTLNLPLEVTPDDSSKRTEFYLRCEREGLTLYREEKGGPGGLRVDFERPQLARRAGDKLLQQNLCKAAGLKYGFDVSVLDTTAGLGKDAWLLASAGAEVFMLERDPVVHALLQDALRRTFGDPAGGELGRIRVTLQFGDFVGLAATLPEFDVVYLDPMFPTSGKQARAKKDMYLLQRLLGEHYGDETEMLQLARSRARKRVVVKRARLSPWLGAQKPDVEFKGSSNRYDVYLVAFQPG